MAPSRQLAIASMPAALGCKPSGNNVCKAGQQYPQRRCKFLAPNAYASCRKSGICLILLGVAEFRERERGVISVPARLWTNKSCDIVEGLLPDPILSLSPGS